MTQISFSEPKTTVDNRTTHCYNINVRFGGIAQLGERLTGSQEVSGSIPLISTNERLETVRFQAFYFFAFIVRFSFVRNLFGMTSVIERKPSIHNECRAFLHFIR